jgi:hypothetical protein
MRQTIAALMLIGATAIAEPASSLRPIGSALPRSTYEAVQVLRYRRECRSNGCVLVPYESFEWKPVRRTVPTPSQRWAPIPRRLKGM